MPAKRKVGSVGLERRVRPRREEQWQPEPEEAASAEDVSEGEGEDSDSEQEPASGSESEEEDEEPAVNLAAVSFGALARAQASLPPPSRKKSKNEAGDEDEPQESSIRKPYSKPAKPPSRSSKHAPQEQTSKKPVSRRREILPDNRRQARDPRFDPAVARGSGNSTIDEARARRAYAFLDEYRDSEIADLKVEVKKTKNEVQKEVLKRQLLSLESKRKAQLRKDEAEKLLSDHRKSEKDMVAQGKTPFYLKKSEQKKKLLMDRYASMTKGQVDHAIERKRKKVAGKEKKELGALEDRRR